MKNMIVLMAACALVGCKSTPGPVRIETVEVLKPVKVFCVERNEIPGEPEKVSHLLNGDARHDLDIISVSAIHLRQAFRTATALLEGCVKPD